MTIPSAIVTVRPLRITGIPSSLHRRANGDLAFAIIYVNNLRVGRSAAIPPGATDINLGQGLEHWKKTVEVSSGQAIQVRAELWILHQDRSERGVDADVSGTIADPWAENSDLSIGGGGNPVLHVEVRTLRVPGDSSTIATVSSGSASARVMPAAIARITRILGVERPTSLGTTIPIRCSEAVDGYLSDDDQGRIFLHRTLRGQRQRDEHIIELEAVVTMRNGTLPSDGTKIVWKMEVPPEVANSDENVHVTAAPDLDPSAFSVSSGTSTLIGTQAGVNRSPVSGSPWVEVSSFTLEAGDSTDTTKTAIVEGLSRVKLKCPASAGDRIAVTARLDTTSTSVTIVPCKTGTMTMWNLIQVEYAQMPSAREVPVHEIPGYYQRAFLQMDILERHEITDREVIPGANPRTYAQAAHRYVQSRGGVFNHYQQPGWFCLVAAQQAYRTEDDGLNHELSLTNDVVYTGPVTLATDGRFEVFELPIASVLGVSSTAPARDTANIRKVFVLRNGITARPGYDYVTQQIRNGNLFLFDTEVSVSRTNRSNLRFTLSGNDIISDLRFDIPGQNPGKLRPPPGSRYFFLPNLASNESEVLPGNPGYSLGTTIQVIIAREVVSSLRGLSPSTPIRRENYFSGRTIVFTRSPSYTDDTFFREDASLAGVHEFAHSLGFPHKCGNWDYRSNRTNSCCMNYPRHGLVGTDMRMMPNTSHRESKYFCSKHLKELRNVRLPDLAGTTWRWT